MHNPNVTQDIMLDRVDLVENTINSLVKIQDNGTLDLAANPEAFDAAIQEVIATPILSVIESPYITADTLEKIKQRTTEFNTRLHEMGIIDNPLKSTLDAIDNKLNLVQKSETVVLSMAI
jgi:hypothetical protein